MPNNLMSRLIGHNKITRSHHIAHTRPKAIRSSTIDSGANAGVPELPNHRPMRKGMNEINNDRKVSKSNLFRAKKLSELLTSGIGAV